MQIVLRVASNQGAAKTTALQLRATRKMCAARAASIAWRPPTEVENKRPRRTTPKNTTNRPQKKTKEKCLISPIFFVRFLSCQINFLKFIENQKSMIHLGNFSGWENARSTFWGKFIDRFSIDFKKFIFANTQFISSTCSKYYT